VFHALAYAQLFHKDTHQTCEFLGPMWLCRR
jgi:hypothetical protein